MISEPNQAHDAQPVEMADATVAAVLTLLPNVHVTSADASARIVGFESPDYVAIVKCPETAGGWVARIGNAKGYGEGCERLPVSFAAGVSLGAGHSNGSSVPRPAHFCGKG